MPKANASPIEYTICRSSKLGQYNSSIVNQSVHSRLKKLKTLFVIYTYSHMYILLSLQQSFCVIFLFFHPTFYVPMLRVGTNLGQCMCLNSIYYLKLCPNYLDLYHKGSMQDLSRCNFLNTYVLPTPLQLRDLHIITSSLPQYFVGQFFQYIFITYHPFKQVDSEIVRIQDNMSCGMFSKYIDAPNGLCSFLIE